MSSSDPLYHGTAWPLKEGEDLTYEAAPLRNYDQEILGDYGGNVYATRNLQAAQFYADAAGENSGMPIDSIIYEVKHTGENLEADPSADWPGDDIRADKLTVIQEHSRTPASERPPRLPRPSDRQTDTGHMVFDKASGGWKMG
jgi:hypothetical protein